MPGLDQSAVRRVNTAVILRALAATTDTVTLQQLVASTSLSRRTVEVVLGELAADGWVLEAPSEGDGGAGRPARRYRFAADRWLLAGVRIDTHAVHGVVADLAGRVCGRSLIELGDAYYDPALAVRLAAEAVRRAAHDAGVDVARLGAGAIAAGGVIDPDSGAVLRLVNAPRWAGFALTEAMRAEVDIPWVADNDANLAAIAELHRGSAIGRRHVAWLIHGHRNGAGLIVDGEPHRGARGGAGELIESRVLGIERDPREGIALLTSPDQHERRRGHEALAAARAGGPDAVADVERLADRITDVIDVIAWTLAPELVVLGGGLEDAADPLLPLVRERLDARGLSDLDLAASTVGADAALLGAVMSALDHVDRDLYGPTVG